MWSFLSQERRTLVDCVPGFNMINPSLHICCMHRNHFQLSLPRHCFVMVTLFPGLWKLSCVFLPHLVRFPGPCDAERPKHRQGLHSLCLHIPVPPGTAHSSSLQATPKHHTLASQRTLCGCEWVGAGVWSVTSLAAFSSPERSFQPIQNCCWISNMIKAKILKAAHVSKHMEDWAAPPEQMKRFRWGLRGLHFYKFQMMEMCKSSCRHRVSIMSSLWFLDILLCVCLLAEAGNYHPPAPVYIISGSGRSWPRERAL